MICLEFNYLFHRPFRDIKTLAGVPAWWWWIFTLREASCRVGRQFELSLGLYRLVLIYIINRASMEEVTATFGMNDWPTELAGNSYSLSSSSFQPMYKIIYLWSAGTGAILIIIINTILVIWWMPTWHRLWTGRNSGCEVYWCEKLLCAMRIADDKP